MNRRFIIVGLVCSIVVLVFLLFSTSFSKYQTNGVGQVNSNVAFYLLKPGYMTNQIKLSDLSPSDDPYVYTFSVSNTDGTNRCEVDMSYVVKIVTTTNIPLRYELYMNENYQNNNATNLININNTVIAADDDGTYFQTFTLNSVNMYYNANKTDNYTLLVYYDDEVKNSKYQDTIEGIRIDIDSQQIIE